MLSTGRYPPFFQIHPIFGKVKRKLIKLTAINGYRYLWVFDKVLQISVKRINTLRFSEAALKLTLTCFGYKSNKKIIKKRTLKLARLQKLVAQCNWRRTLSKLYCHILLDSGLFESQMANHLAANIETKDSEQNKWWWQAAKQNSNRVCL